MCHPLWQRALTEAHRQLETSTDNSLNQPIHRRTALVTTPDSANADGKVVVALKNSGTFTSRYSTAAEGQSRWSR